MEREGIRYQATSIILDISVVANLQQQQVKGFKVGQVFFMAKYKPCPTSSSTLVLKILWVCLNKPVMTNYAWQCIQLGIMLMQLNDTEKEGDCERC